MYVGTYDYADVGPDVPAKFGDRPKEQVRHSYKSDSYKFEII